MQRKVERKVIATFCAPERHHHAMVVARMLRSGGIRQGENFSVRPEGRVSASREGIEDEAGCEAASKHRAIKDQPRQWQAEDLDRVAGWLGQTGYRADEIDHERQADAVPGCQDAAKSDTAQLDPTLERWVWLRRETPSLADEADSVVAHQRCRKADEIGAIEQEQGQSRFTGTGLAPNQQASLAEGDAGGVGRLAGGVRIGHRVARRSGARQRLTAGRRTMNRAPRTVGSPSSSAGPGRFSALIVPRWAWTICREIERPRPEFWPKPCSGLSV